MAWYWMPGLMESWILLDERPAHFLLLRRVVRLRPKRRVRTARLTPHLRSGYLRARILSEFKNLQRAYESIC